MPLTLKNVEQDWLAHKHPAATYGQAPARIDESWAVSVDATPETGYNYIVASEGE
jgi:hypothetical protein